MSKPTSPAAHWVFPKKGAPYLVADELPADSVELEAKVVGSFIDRLRDLGHDVEEHPRPNEWPDAALVVDGERVGLEAVEVVDAQHRQQVNGHGWYVEELRSAFAASGTDGALLGMALELTDDYRGLPPARSRAARELVSNIAAQMAECQESLAASELNIMRIVDVSAEPWKVKIFGARVADDADDYGLRWNGAYAADPLCLSQTVAAKIGQRYAGRGSFDRLWLLAWDSFGYLLTSDKEPASRLLDTESHSFDAVWTCYLAGGSVAFVERLWPDQRS